MDTHTVYAKVFTRLVRLSGASSDLSDGGVALCSYLAKRVSTGQISWATAKQYASAIRWHLRAAELSVDEFEREWNRLRPLRTSARRRKRASRKIRITGDEISAIHALSAFREQRSFWAASALFHASVLLGLRPCEWADARWADKGRMTLIVRNAKAAATVMDHGPFTGRLWVRGNGAARALRLTPAGIDAGVQDLVDEVLNHEMALPWSRSRGVIWRSFKTLVRAAIEREMIAPKFRNLTIYSARHQFSADAKRAMDVASGEVAAAMGHVSVRTAVSGYGRRHYGGSFAPAAKPDAASIQAVANLTLRRARPTSSPTKPPSPSLSR